jgi:hypothetical protein
MSGSQPTNNAAVDFEKEQAAEADQKEAERQQRLTQGQTLIDQIFNGSPVMGTKTNTFDWSTFDPMADLRAAASTPGGTVGSNLPAGYTAVQVAAPSGAKTAAPSYNVAPSYSTSARGQTTLNQPASAAGGGSGGMTWAVKGPDGKIYNQSDPLSYDTQYDTGQTTGGFDDAFFNNYKQKVLDYYQPDEQRQYDAAQRDLKYSLARAGTLQSSTAADKQGELAYNDALQKANIVANANSQEGQLKSQIQSNKQALINQLYTTEDPTLTANLAQSSAQASRLQDPTLTPAAALFTPALTTVGSAVQGLLYPSGQGGSAFANPNQGPVPTSATGGGSDKLYTT